MFDRTCSCADKPFWFAGGPKCQCFLTVMFYVIRRGKQRLCKMDLDFYFFQPRVLICVSKKKSWQNQSNLGQKDSKIYLG